MTRPLHDALHARPVPVAHHVTLALEGRRLLADGSAGRRMLARIVYEHLDGEGLVSFGAADDHMHLLVARDRMACGRMVRSLAGAIHKRLGHEVAFEPSRFRPVEDARHLRNTYLYGFRQEQRHGTGLDPFLDASSLPERIGARVLFTRAREPVARVLERRPVLAVPLVGSSDGSRRRGAERETTGCRIRTLGGATARLAETLVPRVHVGELRELVGGAGLAAAPMALEQLADAAAAAVGLGDLAGSDPATILARRAAVQLAAPSMALSEVAAVLGTPRRTVQRDAREATFPTVLRAVEMQLRMRGARLLGREVVAGEEVR